MKGGCKIQTSSITHIKKDAILIIRESYIDLCDDRNAGILLSYFEYWHNIKIGMIAKNKQMNDTAERHGYERNQDETHLQFHTKQEIYEQCMKIVSYSGIVSGRKKLVELGFISEQRNPNPKYKFDNTVFFRLHTDKINNALNAKYPTEQNGTTDNDDSCTSKETKQHDSRDGSSRRAIQNDSTSDTKQSDERDDSLRTIPETTTETTTETTPKTTPKKRTTDPEIIAKFNIFWDQYDKKTGRPKCYKKFISLKNSDIEHILKHVPEYVQSTPDKKFRKNPLTYLNNESWNDEIINNKKLTPFERTTQTLNNMDDELMAILQTADENKRGQSSEMTQIQ